MSNLPAGAVLTSINGKKCTAVPRNVTNPEDTNLEDIVTATTAPGADSGEDATGELPPGGILMEAPLSQEFPALSSAFGISEVSTSDAAPEPTETQADGATSSRAPEGQFRRPPGQDDDSEEGNEDEQIEDPATSEDIEDAPTETSTADEISSDEDEIEEDPASPTSEGSIEGAGNLGIDEEDVEENEDPSVATSAQSIVEDEATQSGGSPEPTGDVVLGTGGSEIDNGESSDGRGPDDGEDGGNGDSANGSDSDDEDELLEDSEDSESEERTGNTEDEDEDGSTGGGDGDSTDDENEDENDSGGAGAVPSSTGDDPITTTLEGGVVTTIPPPPGNDPGSPSDGPDTDVAGSVNGNSDESRQAGIIAGSVVGSLAAVALVGFLLFWFWRKRSQRQHKYIIQTPVIEPPNSSRTDKTWDFDNGSIGPTNKTARMKEAVEYRFDAIGRAFNKPPPAQPKRKSQVNMDRGNSQFFATGALPPRSRDNPDIQPDDDELSNQDRLGNWFSRVKEDANFNWGVRNEDPEMSHRAGPSRGIGQRTSSSQDFSGALGLMINDARGRGNDPFSDDYAFNQAGYSEGYAVHQTPPLRNPFDDANSIQPLAMAPPSYDPRAHQRRSTTGSLHRQTSSPLRQQISSPYQRSGTTTPLSRHQTATPLSRGAVRSDQFDLEISEPHPGTLVPMPQEVVTRETSIRSFTSRVSSLSDWDDNRGNERGDVGAAALRWADEKSPGIGKAQ